MQTFTCFIGLGSNQLNPKQQLEDAIESLTELPQCTVIAHSSFYQSSPLVCESISSNNEHKKPADYYNAVLKMKTCLLPFQLLLQLQQIEVTQGRVRHSKNRWASRTLDLDILLYADTVIQTQQLIIPHYAMRLRDFVLKPLLEVEKEVIFEDAVPASVLLQQCDDNNLRRIEGTSKNL